jgi:exopolysaccharide production protein ExoZ
MADGAATQKFAGIEACRGVAAAVVVFYHAARHLDQAYGLPGLARLFQFGHAGVDLFFVLSGFIIAFVHYDDVGRPERLGHYIERRLTRILPLYWIALGLTVSLSVAGGHAPPAFSALVQSALLIPSETEPLLGVAWTLQYEISFYAVFCLLLLHRAAGLLVFFLWLSWIALSALGFGPASDLPASLYGAYNLEFFLGMGIAFWLKNHTVRSPSMILSVGAGLIILAAVAENTGLMDGYADPARLFYGLPAAMIVLGMAAMERRSDLKVPGIFSSLGAASYSIYLFQFIFMGAVWKLWLAVGLDTNLPPVASFPVLAVAGILGGVMVSRWIEYPLMRWVRHRRRPRVAASPQAGGVA